jgi:hypothetical protein
MPEIDYRMASASGRFLPHFVGIIVLALLGLGCLERAKGTARAEPALTKQAVVALVAQSLTSSGMPEPPLRKDSTRADRKEYLSATQGALEQLRKIGLAPSENRQPSAELLLEDRTEQVLAISRLLAVELADAIDRSDKVRARATVRTAADYGAFVSDRSVPDWLASASIADTLAVGVKSVATQLDSDMADAVAEELARLEAGKTEPSAVLLADARRIEAWFASAELIREPLTAEAIEKMAGARPDARAGRTDAFAKAVEVIAPNGLVPVETFIAEARIAVDAVATYLKEPNREQPTADSSRHPIAAYIISLLRPTFIDAQRLDELRAENWRLLALTVKVAAADLPEDLSAMGELAISPVSKLPFEYVRREGDFDLARPRPKVDSNS